MNYTDMLLMDYFDEDYGFFNEGKAQKALKKAQAQYDLYDNAYNLFKGYSKDMKDYDPEKEKAIIRMAKKLKIDGVDDKTTDEKIIKKFNDDNTRKKILSKLYDDKRAMIDHTTTKDANGKKVVTQGALAQARIDYNNVSKNENIKQNQAAHERNLRKFLKSREGRSLIASSRNKSLKGDKLKDAINAINGEIDTDAKLKSYLTTNHDEIEKIYKKYSEDKGKASANKGETPEEVGIKAKAIGKIGRAKGYVTDHKYGAGAVGAGAAGAAGAVIAGKGIHDLVTLKNPAKARAAWKASGSNLPFNEWLKKEKKKAGIKTAIGGVATFAGAGGAGYLGRKQYKMSHNEAIQLGELLNQYDDVLMEEAYLEGYYGQLAYIVESMNYDYDDYYSLDEDYDFFDEDYEDDFDYDDYYDEDYEDYLW